jgi:hypothetical protein
MDKSKRTILPIKIEAVVSGILCHDTWEDINLQLLYMVTDFSSKIRFALLMNKL